MLQSVGERWHAIPAQLHVVVEAAADRMHVRIVQPWNDGSRPLRRSLCVAGPRRRRISCISVPVATTCPPEIARASTNEGVGIRGDLGVVQDDCPQPQGSPPSFPATEVQMGEVNCSSARLRYLCVAGERRGNYVFREFRGRERRAPSCTRTRLRSRRPHSESFTMSITAS